MFLCHLGYKGDCMEFRQLECFAKTAELGSFTKAASVLHISQPALSKNIHLLEEKLGVQLFDRHGKKVTLNETGQLVLMHAQAIMNHCGEIVSVCKKAKGQEDETVTLQITAGSEFLPELLAGFSQRYPRVDIVSLQSHNDENNNADVSVSASVFHQDRPYHRSVFQEPLALAVPQNHPLFQQERAFFSDIQKYPLISLRAGNDMRTIEDFYFGRAGIIPHRAIECDTPSTLRALLKKGIGMAFVPTITWRSILDSELRLIPMQEMQCFRYINVALLHPENCSLSARAFYDYILEYYSGIG